MRRQIEGVAWRMVLRSGRWETDAVAVEEPLEIRIDGETIATILRTPGDDAALALGFLFGEGAIASIGDVGSFWHGSRPDEQQDIIDVRSAHGARLACERHQPPESLLARIQPIDDAMRMPHALIISAVDRLRSEQPLFAATGGLHAAAAFDAAGELLCAREDIGRHNAVDKVVGTLLRRQVLPHAALLVVSSRASFEIVQKAAVARIAVVASVSAASALAIDLAAAAHITLCGFVRAGTCSIYTRPERLA